MTGYVTDARGKKWALPPLLAWRMEYATGTPCDSFWLRCVWEMDSTAKPKDWVGFYAEHEGQRVFTGVVDECEVSQTGQGCRVEVSGRGMAALLLDNEALGQDYTMATQEDILRDHVRPYGITVKAGKTLPAVARFSVATGSSEWSVLYEFARYRGGVAPRFDREGRLVLTGWEDTKVYQVDDMTAVLSLLRRDRRYGVLSQVLVRDRYSGNIQTVNNQTFSANGGRARQVVTMPGRSDYKTMRYTGQFQLDKSADGLEEVEVTVAQPFSAWPGDLIHIQRSNWDWNGQYRVAQAVTGMDESGYWTRLELKQTDFVG